MVLTSLPAPAKASAYAASMARTPQDRKHTQRDRPGQRPLLQGHLRRGSGPVAGAPPAVIEPEAIPGGAALPAAESSHGEADAVPGKATSSPADVATRQKVEGDEPAPA